MTRIVGGAAGGRRLSVPAGRDVRPTSDRVREGLFSTLESMIDLVGSSFLDLYAGSGAVALEAASRGATRAVAVERAPAAVAAIRRNAGAELAIELHAVPVARFLADPPAQPFDVVFVDPPYAEPVEVVLRLLVTNDWLAPGALVVVERATRSDPPEWPDGIGPDRSRRYGDTTLWYGRRP